MRLFPLWARQTVQARQKWREHGPWSGENAAGAQWSNPLCLYCAKGDVVKAALGNTVTLLETLSSACRMLSRIMMSETSSLSAGSVVMVTPKLFIVSLKLRLPS